MTEWPPIKEVGRELQADFLKYFRKVREGLPEKLADQRTRLDKMEPLGAAIRSFYEGDEHAVTKYVENHELSNDDWRQLVDFYNGELAPPRQGRGQPKGNPRGVARIASDFYIEWRKANERAGVNDHRHRERMREEAVRFICEDFLSGIYGMVDHDQQSKVLDYMRRPRSRRI